MEQAVVLSKLEREHLLHAIEASLQVRDAGGLCLWTQGQVQAMLPHQAMVCLQVGPDGEVLRAECLQGGALDLARQARLAGPSHGLAVRLWRASRAALPVALDARDAQDGHGGAHRHRLACFQPELQSLGLRNALLHGAAGLPGGGTFFALFGMPHPPGPRDAYFLQLLLPHLHLALLRLPSARVAALAARQCRRVSRRELEILQWVREGKSNDEVGQILGISGWTVKNHLQRIYKALGVSNRAQAVAHGIALSLLEPGAAGRLQ